MDTAHRLELSTADRLLLVVGLTGLGAGLGAVLPPVSAWVRERNAPFPSWLHALASPEHGWLLWGRPVIGAVIGVVASLVLIDQAWRIEVSRERVLVRRGREVRRIPRERVGAVYRSGRTLVIEDADGVDLFTGTVEGDRSAPPTAFLDLGYPWHDDV